MDFEILSIELLLTENNRFILDFHNATNRLKTLEKQLLKYVGYIEYIKVLTTKDSYNLELNKQNLKNLHLNTLTKDVDIKLKFNGIDITFGIFNNNSTIMIGFEDKNLSTFDNKLKIRTTNSEDTTTISSLYSIMKMTYKKINFANLLNNDSEEYKDTQIYSINNHKLEFAVYPDIIILKQEQ